MTVPWRFHSVTPDAEGIRFDFPSTTNGSGRYFVPKEDEFSTYRAYNFEGWDGCDGEPISTQTINTARRFKNILPDRVPWGHAAPAGDGTIGIEWRSNAKVQTLIEIGPGSLVKATRVFADGSSKTWPERPIEQATIAYFDEIFPRDEAD